MIYLDMNCIGVDCNFFGGSRWMGNLHNQCRTTSSSSAIVAIDIPETLAPRFGRSVNRADLEDESREEEEDEERGAERRWAVCLFTPQVLMLDKLQDLFIVGQ